MTIALAMTVRSRPVTRPLSTGLCALFGVVCGLGALSSDVAVAQSADDRADPPLSPQPPGVAIIVVAAIGLDRERADSMGDRLADVLEDALLIDAKSHRDTRALLRRPVAESCVEQARCIRRLGARLEVDMLLFLAVVRIGTRFKINVTRADAATGTTQPRPPIQVNRSDEEAEAFQRAARLVLPEAVPRRREPPPAPPSVAEEVVEQAPEGEVEPPTAGPASSSENSTAPDDLAIRPPSARPMVRDRGQSVRPGRRMTTGVWLAGGLGVLALAGGATFGIMAVQTDGQLSDFADCTMDCTPPSVTPDDLRTQSRVADALFVIGAASSVAAVVMYLRSGSGEERRSGAGMALTPTGTGIEFSVSGRF